jgi:hypothetical protein
MSEPREAVYSGFILARFSAACRFSVVSLYKVIGLVMRLAIRRVMVLASFA